VALRAAAPIRRIVTPGTGGAVVPEIVPVIIGCLDGTSVDQSKKASVRIWVLRLIPREISSRLSSLIMAPLPTR
jgi:hypothetical protein